MKKIKALVKKVKGKLLAVASEEVEDRAGEVISIDGWNLKNFKSNPRLLWSHDHNIPSVGNAENIRFEEVKGKKKRGVKPTKKIETQRMILLISKLLFSAIS